MKSLLLACILIGCLCAHGTQAVAQIPLVSGGLVYATPIPDDPNLQGFWGATLVYDKALTAEPGAVPDPWDDPAGWAEGSARFVVANLRFGALVYEEGSPYVVPPVGDNGDSVEAAPTALLDLLADSIPVVAGISYAPWEKWRAAWVAGLELLKPPAPGSTTALSLMPTYGSGGMGFQFRADVEF